MYQYPYQPPPPKQISGCVTAIIVVVCFFLIWPIEMYLTSVVFLFLIALIVRLFQR